MRDHKSLLAWQEANAVARSVLLETRNSRDPTATQLQRAALSVQLNIAEGYAHRSLKRFRFHLNVAYASAVETAELLEMCGEIGHLQPELGNAALKRCRRCQALLLGLVKRLKAG